MRWLFILPLTILAAYSVFAAVKYTRMISNIFMGLVYRASADSATTSRGEKITVLDSSDREIEITFLENAGAKKILIFCHESGAVKESWEKYAYFFPAWGYHVLSVDLPEDRVSADENSLTQWPDENEVEKLLTVIRWSRKAIRDDAKIVLFGVSKGANLALALADKDPNVVAVVTDGLFSMKEIFRDYIRRWAPILVKPNLFGEKYPYWVVNVFAHLGYWHCQKRSGRKFIDVERLLRQNRKPLCMIHGGQDDYVSPTHQVYLGRLLGERNTSRLVVPEAAHNQAIVASRARYEQTIEKFLKDSLV